MNPLRSEQDAFKITIFVAIVCLPIALAAIVFTSSVALGVAAGLAYAGFVYLIARRRRRERLGSHYDPAADPGEDELRLLVVADQALTAPLLRREIAYRVRGYSQPHVEVVCPVLVGGLRSWTNERDQTRAQAQVRLNALLGELAEDGMEAAGELGDEQPIKAIEACLQRFRADQVLIAVGGDSLDQTAVDQARERFAVPINQVAALEVSTTS